MTDSTTPVLEMRGISKAFGSIDALKCVGLRANRGEVHALVGENGAGKSTLMKILSGAIRADAGEVTLCGMPFRPRSPLDARRRGIAMIYQELTLASHLTVAENITLGAERQSRGLVRRQNAEVAQVLALLGYGHLDTDLKAGVLSTGEQQVVEIARALFRKANLIIMDEPTSSLSAADTEALFATVRRLTGGGVTVVYISHFLEEVALIADRYTVLRDGLTVASGSMGETSLPELVNFMIGRPLTEMYVRTPHSPGEVVLSVDHLTSPPQVVDVSFRLRRGEILGIAGLLGAGRTELLRSLYGLSTARSGTVRVRSRRVAGRISPRNALRSGIGMLSEDRKEEGMAVSRSLVENVTLSSLHRYVRAWTPGMIDTARERAEVERQVAALNVRCQNVHQRTGDLSGGNQQKVLLARLLLAGGDILLLDEPTRGIDVGSKAEIYRIIDGLATQGKAILMVSSYLPELFGMCDSLAVMHKGRLSEVRPVKTWTEASVMVWATTGRADPIRESRSTVPAPWSQA